MNYYQCKTNEGRFLTTYGVNEDDALTYLDEYLNEDEYCVEIILLKRHAIPHDVTSGMSET